MDRHAKLVEASQEEMLKTVLDRETATVARYDARLSAQDELLKEMAEALNQMVHAVCGDTGFAECVRKDSGLAYPWPALDRAEEQGRATLAKYDAMKEERG
jgi:hypothetical protein